MWMQQHNQIQLHTTNSEQTPEIKRLQIEKKEENFLPHRDLNCSSLELKACVLPKSYLLIFQFDNFSVCRFIIHILTAIC